MNKELINKTDLEWIEEQLEILLDDMQSNIQELTRIRNLIRNKLGWVTGAKQDEK